MLYFPILSSQSKDVEILWPFIFPPCSRYTLGQLMFGRPVYREGSVWLVMSKPSSVGLSIIFGYLKCCWRSGHQESSDPTSQLFHAIWQPVRNDHVYCFYLSMEKIVESFSR